MKLIICPECQDVVKLTQESRSCSCGACYGRYYDNKNCQVSENAVVIGFSNPGLLNAVQCYAHDSRQSHEFKAFVLPSPCSSISRVKL